MATKEPHLTPTHKLPALLEVTRSLATQMDLDDLLQLIVAKTSEVLKAERGTVYVCDLEKRELWSRVAQLEELKEIRLSMDGPGLASHVARTGETIHLADAYDDTRFNREFDRATGWRTRAMDGYADDQSSTGDNCRRRRVRRCYE